MTCLFAAFFTVTDWLEFANQNLMTSGLTSLSHQKKKKKGVEWAVQGLQSGTQEMFPSDHALESALRAPGPRQTCDTPLTDALRLGHGVRACRRPRVSDPPRRRSEVEQMWKWAIRGPATRCTDSVPTEDPNHRGLYQDRAGC